MPPHRRPIHTVFQSYALFPHMSVFENVAYGLRGAAGPARDEVSARVEEALEKVHMGRFCQAIFPGKSAAGKNRGWRWLVRW